MKGERMIPQCSLSPNPFFVPLGLEDIELFTGVQRTNEHRSEERPLPARPEFWRSLDRFII
jgi:hypothetical protein